MPSATQSSDVRVRKSTSTTQLAQQHTQTQHTETDMSCKQACCAAPAPAPSSLQRQPSSTARPALNRNAASTATVTSIGSGGTDDASHIQSDDGTGLPDFGDTIDSTTFEQILEMDDDEDEREFSKSIVYDFFTQAEGTFQKMDSKLDARDLEQLSALGHFLKGSSATLGLTKVKDSCEKIQNFGAKKDESGTSDVDDVETCLKNLKEEIKVAKKEFEVVEGQLKRFYHDEGS